MTGQRERKKSDGYIGNNNHHGHGWMDNSQALLDSGCTRLCINETFVKKHNLNMTKLPKAIPVFNMDGMENASGKLTHTLQLKVVIGGHEEIMNFGVSNLGRSNLFLGHNWLKYHNPEINWETKILEFTRCPGACQKEEIGEEPEEEEPMVLEKEDHLLMIRWMFNGGTTTYGSKKGTNGKQHLGQIEGYLNQ